MDEHSQLLETQEKLQRILENGKALMEEAELLYSHDKKRRALALLLASADEISKFHLILENPARTDLQTPGSLPQSEFIQKLLKGTNPGQQD